jgi:SNF2-related domain
LGAFVRTGGDWRRIPEPLFSLAETVEEINRNAGSSDPGGRLAGLAKLKEILPNAADEGRATTSGLLKNVTIAVADAFSLDMEDDQLVPILHGSRETDGGPLLTQGRQAEFAKRHFGAFSDVRSAYGLGGGSYVVLTPALRKALTEVRKAQAAPIARRRALFASPRAFLQTALGQDEGDTAIESVFRETPSYADRVLGLGLWKPRVVPWIKLPGTNWFGEEGGQEKSRADPASHEPAGIIVGERAVPLKADQIAPLAAAVEEAMAAGRASVPFDVDGEQISIPAHRNTLDALRTVAQGFAKQSDEKDGQKPAQEVLLIEPNEEAVAVEGEFVRRARYAPATPDLLATMLKPHQVEGLRWLQKAWTIGRPGVLLADDMGLGKTIQGLGFLAWLKEGMANGSISKLPFLIVAPTGLLRNWLAEHGRHLRSPGLGTCIEAFGQGLSALRQVDKDGRPGLDVRRLAAADWVLTTYETLSIGVEN